MDSKRKGGRGGLWKVKVAKEVAGAGTRENREREGYGRRETGEERAGSGISAMGGKQDRNSKRQAFVVCYCRIIQSKKRTQQQPPLPRPRAPPPPPHKWIRTVPGLQTSFFFLSFVRWLLVYFLFCYFFSFCPSLFKVQTVFLSIVRLLSVKGHV